MATTTPVGMPPFFGSTVVNPEPCCKEDPGCAGCCGRDWDEFPESIEFRIFTDGLVTRPFNYKGTMYKQPYQPDGCRECIKPQKLLTYASQSIKVLTDTWPEDDSETCCVVISLQASCGDGQGSTFEPPPGSETFPPYDPPLAAGECGWALSILWTGGDNIVTWGDVTPVDQNESTVKLSGCNPIALDWGYGTSEGLPACILGNSIAPGVSIEIKEAGVSGGDPAEPCRFLCCETLADTLYATITSSCPELDGKVVELRSGNQAWVGEIAVASCEVYKIVVSQHDRYAELDTCPLSISVLSTKGSMCFSDIQNLGTAPACPPWSAGGTISVSCGVVCGDHTISIEITE